MLKKALPFVIFMFIVSCGYKPMLSKKNTDNYAFSISKLIFEGDKIINLKVKQKLNNYKLNKAEKNFSLRIISTSDKIILAKDLRGDPTNFKNITTLNVDVLANNTIKNRLQLQASFNYNNNKNKLDLKKYEKEIKKNLAETVTNKLIFKLSNIQ